MKKYNSSSSTVIAISIVIWSFVIISQLIMHVDKVNTLKEQNAQLESMVEELREDNVRAESLLLEAQRTIDTISEDQKQYVKIQNRMSMDFSAEDARYICAFIDAKGGTIADRAFNMVVLLNDIYYMQIPIKEYVTCYLGDDLSFDLENPQADKEAYKIVTYSQWDDTNGERRFR